MSKKLFSIPPVEQFASRSEWEKACWNKIVATPRPMIVLVTAKERHILVLRIAIIDRVLKGKSYTRIAKELQVSPQTISIVKKAMREHAFVSYRQRGKTERKPFKKFRTFSDPLRRGSPRRMKYGTVYIP